MPVLARDNASSQGRLIELPWGAWYGDGYHEIRLPANWTIDVLAPQSSAACSAAAINDALSQPRGSPSLEELAADCKSVCLVVDDLARPTRAAAILQPLLERLHQFGIAEESIDIVVATGSHGELDSSQIGRKVGEEIARSYRTQCHDCRGDLALTGITYGDRELCINRTFIEADLKIAIGCVLPHSFAGYSGGAKMILPGLADLPATARSHKFVQLGLRGGSDPNENRFRTEAEDIARRLGLRFAVCVVTNLSRDSSAIYAGDPVSAHRAACADAQEAYATNIRDDYNVAVLNAYPKDIDLVQADNVFVALKTPGAPIIGTDGVYVLTTAASQGIGHHGLFAPGGLSHRAPVKKRQLRDRELWIYTPQIAESDVRQLYWDGYPVFHDAESLHQALQNRFPEGTKCCVLPGAPMQQVRDLRTRDD